MKHHTYILIFAAVMAAACCRSASGAGDAAARPDDQDCLPVRESAMTADTPLPDAAATWAGGAGQCFVLHHSTPIRREKLDDWSLERSLDLMQSMGVTEIYWSHRAFREVLKGGCHPCPAVLPDEFDRVLAEAARRGMTVGLFLNWNDAGIDLASRAYRQSMRNLVDALAAKKRQYPNLTSLWWDEIWCAMSRNSYSNRLDAFRDFCRAEFHEDYPGDAMPPAANPDDKWWRRYIVFKYCIYEDFSRDLVAYSRANGLTSIPFLVNPFAYRRSQGWGHDRYRLSKIGDFTLAPTYYKNPMPVENSIMHLQADFGGFPFTQVLRGLPVEHWTFASMVNNPELIAKCKEIYALAGEWRGARPAEEVAVLTFPPALLGKFLKAEEVHRDHEELLQLTLSAYFAARMLDVRETRLYQQYKILLLPKYAGYSIPQFALDGLLEFVRRGGSLFVIDAEIAVGRRDLTDPAPRTAELAGFQPGAERPLAGPARLAGLMDMQLPLAEDTQAAALPVGGDKGRPIVFAGEIPVGFDRPLGAGRVISLYFDVARQVKHDPARWGYALARLISARHQPAVTAEGNISVQGVIRKGNRLLISLYTAAGPSTALSTEPTQVPEVAPTREGAQGIIRVRPGALGLNLDGFQVFSLADYQAHPAPDGGPWSAAQLEAGIPVAIAPERDFENIVIEPPGTSHPSTFIADLEREKQELAEALQKARDNPPLGYRPFADRIAIQAGGLPPADAPWHEPAATRRLAFAFQADTAAPGEIIAIPAKYIQELAGANFRQASFYLYRMLPDRHETIPCQVLSAGVTPSPATPDTGSGTAEDELVFITDAAAGVNEFLLYCSSSNSAQPANQSGLAERTEGRLVVTNGYSRVEFADNGRITIFAAGANEYSLDITDFGVRFLKSWKTKSPFQLLADGPVAAMVSREVTTPFRNQPAVRLTFMARLYRNSPCLELEFSSNVSGKCNHLRWPMGYIYQAADWQPLRAQTRVFTADGWQRPGFANVPLYDDCQTIVTFGQPPGPRSFGLLLAASTFATPPRWLIETPGLFWLQPTRNHAGFARIDAPLVRYLLVQGLTDPGELDRLAGRLRQKVKLKFSPIQSRE